MFYYCNKHFIEDYEQVPDWDSTWESPNKDLDYEVDVDIDWLDHTKDYLDWWQGCNPHYIDIHDTYLIEGEGDDEDMIDT